MQHNIRTLKKLAYDSRDFSHHKLFGTPDAAVVPNIDFIVSRVAPVILDQKDLPDCTAFSSSELNSHIQGIQPPDCFDPLYQMAKILQVQGDPSATSADLRSAAQSLVTYGSILKSKGPYTYNQGLPTDKPAQFLDDYHNWPASCDAMAKAYALGSFLAVDGPGDAFDNIRAILYKNCSLPSTSLYSGVLFGLNWRPEWSQAPNGIVTDTYTVSAGEGHALLMMGQKMVNGVPYLIVQNSWSQSFGDGGFYYFPRNVINLEYAAGYGAYVFNGISAETAQFMLLYGIKPNDSWVTEFAKVALGIVKKILKL